MVYLFILIGCIKNNFEYIKKNKDMFNYIDIECC